MHPIATIATATKLAVYEEAIFNAKSQYISNVTTKVRVKNEMR